MCTNLNHHIETEKEILETENFKNKDKKIHSGKSGNSWFSCTFVKKKSHTLKNPD